jgi:hypothetical protein
MSQWGMFFNPLPVLSTSSNNAELTESAPTSPCNVTTGVDTRELRNPANGPLGLSKSIPHHALAVASRVPAAVHMDLHPLY